MNEQDVLEVFKETGSLLSGHFELRSGLHSDQFFQCALLLQHPRIAEKLCRAVVDKWAAGEGKGVAVDTVISPALGGIPVGHEVGRALGVRAIFAEKKDDVLEMRRFKIQPGEKVLVAEDVVTRGGRVQETINIVKDAGAEVAGVVVLVDRSGGKAAVDIAITSLLQMEPEVWEPVVCPLCAKGDPLVHPGS